MKIRQIIKEYETPALDAVDATDTYAPPSKGYAIRVLGPLGQRSGTPAATLWYGLTELFPRDYPPANFQSYEARPSSPQSRILDTVSSQGSAVIKSGIASRDLAETLANKLAKFRVSGFDASAGPIPMSNIQVISQDLNEAYDPGLSSKLISAGTKVAEYIFIDKGIRDRKFRIILEMEYNISEEELESHQLYLLRPPNNMGVGRSRELLEWMASKGSELNYDESNPIDFQITIPGSAAYSFNIVKVLRGTNESLDEVSRPPVAPDPQNYDSDVDYYNDRDADPIPPDTDADYENMDDAESDDWFDESREKVGNMDADAFDAALSRMKKLAGAGPLRTVYDPARRVYKNVPHAVQPAQQPKKAR